MSALSDVERRILEACAKRIPCRESLKGRYGERVPCVILGKHEWHSTSGGVSWNGTLRGFLYKGGVR